MARRIITLQEINKCLEGVEFTKEGLSLGQEVVCVSHLPSKIRML